MSSEIEVETVPGLPHALPRGEYVVWQGRPEWRALARQAFSLPWLALYFAVFTGLRCVASLGSRSGIDIVRDVASTAALGVACLGIFSFIAWLNARASVYTITTRRIVMRVGVALPMTWNLPFKRLESADLSVRRSGDGDIVLKLTAPNKIAWLHLWPHVSPWRLVRAQPTLRAIATPELVAKTLAEAVEAWAAAEGTPIAIGSEPRGAAAAVSAPEHATADVDVAMVPAPAGARIGS